MFTIPLYKYKISDWEIKRPKLLNIYKSLPTTLLGNVATTWNLNSNKDVKKFEAILSKELFIFKNEVGINLDMEDFWFQEYDKGMDHSAHTHGPLGFSSVIYIKYNGTKHFSTSFISPYSCNITGVPIKYSPNVCEGDIIFFPANILHYAPHNQVEETRIIASFNLINPRPF